MSKKPATLTPSQHRTFLLPKEPHMGNGNVKYH